MQRIFRTNRRLRRDPKNPYAQERLRIHEIRREIENINGHIEQMQRLKERLQERRKLRTPSMEVSKKHPQKSTMAQENTTKANKKTMQKASQKGVSKNNKTLPSKRNEKG